MARDNVETVRGMYEAFSRGAIDACLECFDPAVEFSQPADEPGSGTFHGHRGIAQAMGRWTAEWDDYRVEVEELTAFGDQVLARTRHHGRGKGSGVPVQQEIFQLLELGGGRIVRMRMYYDEAEALEAAGAAD